MNEEQEPAVHPVLVEPEVAKDDVYDANRLMRNGKDFEFKDQVDKRNSGIISIVKSKLSKDGKSHVVSLRREGEGREGGGLAQLVSETMKYPRGSSKE